ncbi:SpaA isopeptide-forming pilin-related protein [Labedaea rhizosphaerae]|uniref:SpaA-like prealbumin fold domain-containing protein n=1 Tax=Labedaea rhizosphaerae TaxID=598644 RepID=A0A4R6SLN7_LABRH|nr:hypothetical protein [Labedaea rhizosphaerae]TDQ04222.1 hypothetical protein EV186_101164 [Labedaea rhizosphaerae]
MGRQSLRALAATAATAVALSGAAMLVTAPAASAAVKEGLGYDTTPAQPYLHNPDSSDWMGSYVVDGKQVWCVQFAYKAPDSNEQYQAGEELRTKWNTALPKDVAADISYLLLRYSTTKSKDEAAALAHLLHSWTAAPQDPSQLDASNDFRHIAYNAPFHLSKLPASARAAVTRLKADADANHGPWTAKVAAPEKDQVIGTQDDWKITVTGASGKAIGNVPVKVTLTDAEFAEGPAKGKTESTVTTPDDGSALALAVTPTGAKPNLKISLDSPADKPVVRKAVDVDTQRVVSTGGEKTLTSATGTTAVTAPGKVKVAKTDSRSGKAIKGVSLRITGDDGKTAALGQDGKPLVGADGKPAVVVTGSDGTATVPDLKTPQDICVVEVSPAKGYDQAFDPADPPKACGTVKPGDTLALSMTNKPNMTVPSTIPAGEVDNLTATANVVDKPNGAALAGLGVLALAGAGGVGLLIRRRSTGR